MDSGICMSWPQAGFGVKGEEQLFLRNEQEFGKTEGKKKKKPCREEKKMVTEQKDVSKDLKVTYPAATRSGIEWIITFFLFKGWITLCFKVVAQYHLYL